MSIARRARLAPLLVVIACTGLVAGCSAESSASATLSSSSGCWFPGTSLRHCGSLVSIDGQPPGGDLANLPEVIQVSSGLGGSSDRVVLMVEIGACGTWVYPMKVRGNDWYPDGATDDSGCAADAPGGGPDYLWVKRLFEGPINVTTRADGSVRIAAPDSFVDFGFR